MADKWYDDSKVVASFGEALANAEVLTEGSDFAEFLRKPMKFDDVFNAWKDAGYPSSDEEEGWDTFVESIESEDDEDEEES